MTLSQNRYRVDTGRKREALYLGSLPLSIEWFTSGEGALKILTYIQLRGDIDIACCFIGHWFNWNDRGSSKTRLKQRSFDISRAGIDQSVEWLSCYMVWGSSMLDPELEFHQCLYASTWMKWLGCHADCQEVSKCHIRGESEESNVHRWLRMQVRNPPWLL